MTRWDTSIESVFIVSRPVRPVDEVERLLLGGEATLRQVHDGGSAGASRAWVRHRRDGGGGRGLQRRGGSPALEAAPRGKGALPLPRVSGDPLRREVTGDVPIAPDAGLWLDEGGTHLSNIVVLSCHDAGRAVEKPAQSFNGSQRSP